MQTDNRLGEFLRARREVARPDDFGLPEPGRRRTPGRRRAGGAGRARHSPHNNVRLEQGRDKHPSEPVISALARVFALNDEGVAHLRELARPVARRRRAVRAERVSPSLARLLEAWPDTPAMVVGRYLDVLANNRLAAAVNHCSVKSQNQVRVVFLDPDARRIYADWPTVAAETVATLRATAGGDLDDPRLTDLVGELSLKSEDFRRLWARHDVRESVSGTKTFRMPAVGDIVLDWDTYPLPGHPGPVMLVWTAEPGSADADRLQLLASLHATRTARSDKHTP